MIQIAAERFRSGSILRYFMEFDFIEDIHQPAVADELAERMSRE